MKNLTSSASEIKAWLLAILKKENIKDLALNILGSTEKGDGYIGDVFFVHVSGITEDDLSKEYDLVVKCSKRSQALRETSPVKEAFYNEIFVYETLFPYFTQFQLEKGIKTPFNSVPKCYGTFVSEGTEIIVLENLKKSGYDIWPRKNPVTRNHLNLVLGEYARFHAISVALDDQRPGKLQEFGGVLADIMKKFMESLDVVTLYSNSIDEVADMLQDEVEDSVLAKWKDFKKQIHYVLHDLENDEDGLKVILHGDCWNNNFMYKYANGNKNEPISVDLIDWQVSKYSTPIHDLSYHIFTCISGEDLDDLSTILEDYHRNFSEQVKLLGSDPEALYPLKQFLEDWKKYCKWGILISSLMTKMCFSEKDEIVDMAESAESGKDMAQSFAFELRDNKNFKKRMRPIVEYAVKNNLI